VKKKTYEKPALAKHEKLGAAIAAPVSSVPA
jgi:hypothetical protein